MDDVRDRVGFHVLTGWADFPFFAYFAMMEKIFM